MGEMLAPNVLKVTELTIGEFVSMLMSTVGISARKATVLTVTGCFSSIRITSVRSRTATVQHILVVDVLNAKTIFTYTEDSATLMPKDVSSNSTLKNVRYVKMDISSIMMYALQSSLNSIGIPLTWTFGLAANPTKTWPFPSQCFLLVKPTSSTLKQPSLKEKGRFTLALLLIKIKGPSK